MITLSIWLRMMWCWLGWCQVRRDSGFVTNFGRCIHCDQPWRDM